jgi:hypothetical protein
LFSSINFAKITADNESEKDEDSDDETERQCVLVPKLYSPNLNDCVDAILDNKPSHQDMINQLALVHGITKGDSKKYIVRHKAREGSKME